MSEISLIGHNSSGVQEPNYWTIDTTDVDYVGEGNILNEMSRYTWKSIENILDKIVIENELSRNHFLLALHKITIAEVLKKLIGQGKVEQQDMFLGEDFSPSYVFRLKTGK